MAKSRVGKALKIEWEDAWTNSMSWTQAEIDDPKGQPSNPLIMTLYGYCIKDDKIGITVTMETHPRGNDYRIIWHVPKGMIRKVKILK